MATVHHSTGGKAPWLSLTLAGLTAGLFAAFGPAPEAWVYDRAAIESGEWWRLISGHWVHSDGAHLGCGIFGPRRHQGGELEESSGPLGGACFCFWLQ